MAPIGIGEIRIVARQAELRTAIDAIADLEDNEA
jgi:hypothetical protein